MAGQYYWPVGCEKDSIRMLASNFFYSRSVAFLRTHCSDAHYNEGNISHMNAAVKIAV